MCKEKHEGRCGDNGEHDNKGHHQAIENERKRVRKQGRKKRAQKKEQKQNPRERNKESPVDVTVVSGDQNVLPCFSCTSGVR